MTKIPYLFVFLSVLLVGCTDLSKLEKEDKKDPLEASPSEAPAPEKVAAPAPMTVAYPFDRMIKDQNGRSIDATILTKFDSSIGFEKKSGIQKFILPLERLSEDDQVFFKGIYDGGDSQSVTAAVAKAARLGNREAAWNRDIAAAKREGEKLGLPRLTVFFIAGDAKSKSLEKTLLFSRKFRKWAGQNLVICSIPVEPPGSRMAITSAMAENRKAAELYGVRDMVTAVLDIPGKNSFFPVPLKEVETEDDMIIEIEKVMKKRMR